MSIHYTIIILIPWKSSLSLYLILRHEREEPSFYHGRKKLIIWFSGKNYAFVHTFKIWRIFYIQLQAVYKILFLKNLQKWVARLTHSFFQVGIKRVLRLKWTQTSLYSDFGIQSKQITIIITKKNCYRSSGDSWKIICWIKLSKPNEANSFIILTWWMEKLIVAFADFNLISRYRCGMYRRKSLGVAEQELM